MDSFIIYILFSILEATAVNMLILKLYRLPLIEYRLQLMGLSIIIALSSFTMRELLNLSVWDLPLQHITFALFYCYVLKYRLHYATFIMGSGWSAYITIQIFIYYIMESMGLVDKSFPFVNTGFVVNMFQLCSAITAILIATFLRFTGRGFSFIPAPPNDAYKIKYTEYRNLIVLVPGLISVITLSLTPIITLLQKHMLVMFLLIVNFTVSYYFSDRGDYEDVKGIIEKHYKKTKKRRC